MCVISDATIRQPNAYDMMGILFNSLVALLVVVAVAVVVVGGGSVVAGVYLRPVTK